MEVEGGDGERLKREVKWSKKLRLLACEKLAKTFTTTTTTTSAPNRGDKISPRNGIGPALNSEPDSITQTFNFSSIPDRVTNKMNARGKHLRCFDIKRTQ